MMPIRGFAINKLALYRGQNLESITQFILSAVMIDVKGRAQMQ
jgi:hypothetical protein